jgi:N-acetylglutamate synthase-like GNAT family acetyltransferase
MQVIIRPGTDHELSQVLKLQERSIRAFYGQFHTSGQVAELVKTQKVGVCDRKGFWVVAEADGAIIGFASMAHDCCSISAVYVDPNWMKRGVGKQLVQSLENIARENSCSSLSVTADLNTSGFYQKLGFKVVKKYRYPLEAQAPLPCHILAKPLLVAAPAASSRGGCSPSFEFYQFLSLTIIVLSLYWMLGRSASRSPNPTTPTTNLVDATKGWWPK